MKKLLSALICFGLIILILSLVSPLLANKESLGHFPVSDQKASYDVLFFGTSHMHKAVAPMELWENFGFTSYNLSAAGSRIPSIYWDIRCALECTTPKVIVVDCAYIAQAAKTNTQIGNVHKIFDAYSLSLTKIQGMLDLYKNTNHRAEMLWPFAVYHSRWSDLDRNDFFTVDKTNIYKGHVMAFDVCPVSIQNFPESKKTIKSTGAKYLEKIVKLCEQKNIPLLLTYVPFVYKKSAANESSFIKRFADENKIDYIDGNTLLNLINPNTDFADQSSNNAHLNWSGSQKISLFLGQYLQENYDLPDRRHDPAWSDWKETDKDYQEKKWEKFRSQTNIYSCLMRAYDQRLDIIIEMNRTDYLSDSLCLALLENLGVSAEQICNDTRFLVIRKDKKQVEYLNAEAGETFLGILRKNENPAEAEYIVSMNEQPLYTSMQQEKPFLRVTFLDSEKQKIIDSALFSYSIKESGKGNSIQAEKIKE